MWDILNPALSYDVAHPEVRYSDTKQVAAVTMISFCWLAIGLFATLLYVIIYVRVCCKCKAALVCKSSRLLCPSHKKHPAFAFMQCEIKRSQETALLELTLAASAGHTDAVKRLLARGLPIDAGAFRACYILRNCTNATCTLLAAIHLWSHL